MVITVKGRNRMNNYLTYPTKVMRITQTYLGSTSHYPHTTGTPKDYPIDEACSDAGREWFYCPCDEIKVIRIYGVGNGGTNTIWLQSTSKVDFADSTTDYFTVQITHPDDDDLSRLSVGQKFKRGEKICREGTDGANGNHLHMSGGKGTITGNGWVLNSNNKWVLSTTNGAFKPEKLFFVDRSFTKIDDANGLVFKDLPKLSKKTPSPEKKNENKKESFLTGNYKVTKARVLNVRTGPGTEYPYKKFEELSKDAQSQVMSLLGAKVNGYVKGTVFTVTEIKNGWGKSPSGWVSLEYCEKT